jgi:hypothetical protein
LQVHSAWCARPTRGRYVRTPDDPAQRFKGAKPRSACVLRGSLALDALHLLPRDVHRAGELLGLEHPAFHHILNRRTSEAQILGRFRYGDFLAVFVFHPNNTSPPGKDWGRDTPEGYLGPGCTLYVLASLRALAAEVKRLLERLLACIRIDNL